MKHILYSLLGLLLLVGCKEDKYNLIIPMSNVYLSAPQDGFTIDLNDASIDEFSFSWEKPLEKGAKLLLCTTRDFVEPLIIEAGVSTSFSLPSLTVDQALAQLGVKSGKEMLIYWTIKETGNTSAAASDIRSFHAKRMSTILEQPEDLSNIALAEDNTAATVNFVWDTSSFPESTTYTVHLSLDPKMEQSVAAPKIDVTNGKCTLTHDELQGMLEQLAIKRWNPNAIYWNVKSNSGQWISRASGSLIMTEMMRFTDVRGDEKITYRVARIVYPDKTSKIWLADNLRTTKYPDGTAIAPEDYLNTPESFGAGKAKAYGVHYHWKIRNKVIPAGWHLPTIAEFENLFDAPGFGNWNVLKDPQYYEAVKRQENLNTWKLGLCASGQWSGGTSISNHSSQFCYLLASDLDDKCVLHDGAGVLWYPWTTGAPIRFIYNAK